MAETTPKKPIADDMEQVCREYLDYFLKIRQSGPTQINSITRVIKAFGSYLQKSGVEELIRINIEHVDEFMAMFNASYAKTTQRLYRSFLRCFLRYLYNERNLIRQNLADLLISPAMFGRVKPPQFLRPGEIRQLFDRLPHA
ncbi:MAG: site-specific integrase, partial [Desulfobacteraceae bacterium]|nr:site-specific integrase [Desulfobacteraceae bacterium]